MADALISVAGVTVAPGVRSNTVRWTFNTASCLPYLQLAVFEVWSATSNNRAVATKVGESADVSWTHQNIPIGVVRYYWVRARDTSGQFSDFAPLSGTSGVAGTPTSTGTNTIGTNEIIDLDGSKLLDGSVSRMQSFERGVLDFSGNVPLEWTTIWTFSISPKVGPFSLELNGQFGAREFAGNSSGGLQFRLLRDGSLAKGPIPGYYDSVGNNRYQDCYIPMLYVGSAPSTAAIAFSLQVVRVSGFGGNGRLRYAHAQHVSISK